MYVFLKFSKISPSKVSGVVPKYTKLLKSKSDFQSAANLMRTSSPRAYVTRVGNGNVDKNNDLAICTCAIVAGHTESCGTESHNFNRRSLFSPCSLA